MSKHRKKPAPMPQTLSPARQRLFFAITVLIPVMLFVFLEIGLRVAHYGPNLSLFGKEILNGRTYYVMNPEVKSRYFNQVLFSPSTSPDYFVVPKPAGTYRIFCLGGSTTVGYPYWYNGSFSTFLRDRLRKIFPEKEIDIINVGMTATNSFTVLDMARDLVQYEPDLFIVYDGHNEFYGALGIASHESLGSSRWIVNTYLKLIRFRTFLLLREVFTKLSGLFASSNSSDAAGTMMERLALGQYIPYGNTTYRNGLATFKANLEDLRNICVTHHIPLILATQVSNLRDQTPFQSGGPPSSIRQGDPPFSQMFELGLAQWKSGKMRSALATFRSLLPYDSTRADVHYHIARCLDSLGEKTAARSEYMRARDFDQLRFRMSTDFNDVIRQMDDSTSVAVVDMEQLFMENSPDSLIGNNLIVEHLHPHAYGYFLMSKGYAHAMGANGFLAPAEEWRRRDTIRDDHLWADRSLTDLDELIAKRRTTILTSGWPFQHQYPIVDAVPESDTLGQIVENVTRAKWDWQRAHQAAADYYLNRMDEKMAEKEYRVLINQIPHDVQPYLKLAHLFLKQGRLEELRMELLASLRVEPTILAYRALGDVALNTGKPAEAIPMYQGTFAFTQSPAEQVENGYLLALAYSRAALADSAAPQLLKVLKIRPDYQPAIDLLQRLKSPK